MVVWCKYCSLPVEKTLGSLQCSECKGLVHIGCLQSEKISSLEGDRLFELHCRKCGRDFEKITRMKLTWVQAIHLALYNLAVRESGRQGYFRWKDDICGFISQNWSNLFPSKPMTHNWKSTVAGTLSVYCPKLFKSGQSLFNEPGWWALNEVKPPPLSYGDSIKAKIKPKSKEVNERNVVNKNEALHNLGRGKRRQKQIEYNSKKSKNMEENESTFKDLEISDELLKMESTAEENNISDFQMSDEISAGSSEIILNDDPFSLIKLEDIGKSLSKNLSEETVKQVDTPDDSMSESSEVVKSETMSTEGNNAEIGDLNSEQAKTRSRASKPQVPTEPRLLPMNLKQEKEFLYRLNCYPNAIAEDPAAKRLQRKLKLRKLKREIGLPIFDLDQTVQRMIKNSCPEGVNITFTDEYGRELPNTEDENEAESTQARSGCLHHPALQGVNILERFQATIKPRERLKNTVTNSFLSRLIGGNDALNLRSIVSPYTQRMLKPYIRRDYDTKPPKLRIMNEILAYTHRFNHHWIQPCPSPIDYCYVQPHHIPAVNAMCAEFFWNGIDLSECLQYPDFSCVVLYRKLVIGFAFMVPDVKYNEAYISFILVHPDWQRAGIGTFMIYHLIQTCMGKDVTLHVSASNQSMLLYQKFGFKAEEFILDFYDKYLPEDSNECRHAFFLRLQR